MSGSNEQTKILRTRRACVVRKSGNIFYYFAALYERLYSFIETQAEKERKKRKAIKSELALFLDRAFKDVEDKRARATR